MLRGVIPRRGSLSLFFICIGICIPHWVFKFVEGLTKSQYATQASEHTEGATSPYELRT